MSHQNMQDFRPWPSRSLQLVTATFCALLAPHGQAAQVPSSPAVAPVGVIAPAQASNLHWRVDLALVYLDRLARADAATAAPNLLLRPAAVSQPRTLGLKQARLALSWDVPGKAALDVVLRPDAVNRAAGADAASPVRDFDSRSGTPYKPRPTIRLLDAYRLSLAAGQNLAASLGVWEELAPVRLSYPELMAFGLGVQLPAKFSALRLRWREQAVTANPRAASSAGFTGDLYVLQGDEDRAEERASRSNNFDLAPVSADPYYGAATYLAWTGGAWELGLLAGFQDAAFDGGKRNEVQAELVAVYESPAAPLPVKVTFDGRLVQERWRGGGLHIKERTQSSLALSTATAVAPDQWLLCGLHWGKSDDAKAPTEQNAVKTTSGYQIDLGLTSRLAPGLATTFLLTHEERTTKIPGEASKGGFVNANGDRRALRRLGLELNYTLDANS